MDYDPDQPVQADEEWAARRQRQAKILRFLVTAGGTLILAAALLLVFNPSPAQNVTFARIGRPMRAFALTDLNGKTVQLSDYLGTTVLINVWATWCPPCKAEMPLLNAYYQAHRQRGLVILAIDAGDTRAETLAFAQQYGLTFPVLLDLDTQLVDSLGIDSYPTSILVGRDGMIKTIHIGMLTEAMIENEITPLLAQ
jgi:cytochrome c biogenesis protein CcmG, thiol:disulfide interchange protein DsbE